MTCLGSPPEIILRLGVPRQKTTHFQERVVFRPTNYSFPARVWFFGLGTPPPKNHLAKKLLRDLFDSQRRPTSPTPSRQRRGRWGGALASSLGSSESPGPLCRAPKSTPKSLQGRGQYEASDLKITQTKASELKLHSFFTQGHWSSRAEAELAKRKQFDDCCVPEK